MSSFFKFNIDLIRTVNKRITDLRFGCEDLTKYYDTDLETFAVKNLKERVTEDKKLKTVILCDLLLTFCPHSVFPVKKKSKDEKVLRVTVVVYRGVSIVLVDSL